MLFIATWLIYSAAKLVVQYYEHASPLDGDDAIFLGLGLLYLLVIWTLPLCYHHWRCDSRFVIRHH